MGEFIARRSARDRRIELAAYSRNYRGRRQIEKGGQAMDGTGMHEKGEVFIRTRFGEQHESVYRLCRAQMILDKDWREAVGAQGGPFCYTDEERLMPF